LSNFSADQVGLGMSYTDILTEFSIGKLGLKSIDLKYNHYKRNYGLTANYIGFGCKFIVE
jgi:hypothetical protein